MTDIKKRDGAKLTEQQKPATLKDKFFSTNFILAVVLLIGGLFVGFPEGEAAKVVQTMFTLIGSVGVFRTFFKNAEFDPKKWITNSNTWNYLATIFIALFPALTPEFFAAVKSVVEAGLGGNWQGILTALISLSTIIWNIFKTSQLPKVPVGGASIVIILLLSSCAVSAQSNKDLRRSFTANLKALEQDTFDILPFPGEYPQDVQGVVSKRDGTQVAVTNWGATMHRLSTLRSRLAAECKNPVHLRVVDTAMDTDHQQLAKGKQKGYNYTTDAPGLDKNGHGTHCVGIIAAQDFGICYDLIKTGVLTYELDQILGSTGGGSFAWFQSCENQQLQYDLQRKSRGIRTVVSGSFGGSTSPIPQVEAAMKATTDVGTVYCIAAGNTGGEGVQYPGSSAYSITCASLDQSGARSNYSTMGPQVWNGQPGRGIQSTWPNNQFATLSGTSMATPFLSGCVIIAISKWGELLPNYTAVKSYFAAISADIPPTGKDNQTGWGMAFIEKILDTRPTGVNPPTPPNPPIDTTQPPIRGARNLSFEFEGKYLMYWNTTGITSKDGVPKIQKVAKKAIKANANNVLTINRIELQTVSTTTAEWQRRLISDAFGTLIFANRGLVLEGGSDFADAAYWSAFFAELLIYTQYKVKIPITVTRIEATDEKGNSIMFTGDNLKHFPKN